MADQNVKDTLLQDHYFVRLNILSQFEIHLNFTIISIF